MSGRTDLSQQRAAFGNSFAESLDRVPGAKAVENSADESIPCPGCHEIIDAFICQHLDATLQQRYQSENTSPTFRFMQPMPIEGLLGAQLNFVRQTLPRGNKADNAQNVPEPLPKALSDVRASRV